MTSRPCWCGQTALLPFSAEYRCCASCQTLVCDVAANTDFYDWEYFHKGQTSRGVPAIETRARTDLYDRCVYWLNDLARFKLPPARVLELGSAHGGFIALLRQAGYDAIGLDLDPSIVALARKTFDVPMLQGPIEAQTSLEAGSLDVIVLMDVIEHLPDPQATMKHCLRLLKPDGIMLVQTPCYPAGQSLQELKRDGHQFLLHLSPGEHIYLFSEPSLAAMLQRIGAGHVQFRPPIYRFYDMFCVASRVELQTTTREARDEAFSRSVSARMVQAMLDSEDRFRDLLAKHRNLLAQSGSRSSIAA